MILFTNGCSWTAGGGLEPYINSDKDRLPLVWPHHLGKLINSEKTINLSAGCGSNSRILRTTFDWITEQSPEDLAKTIAVIQWSEYSRYEYYVPRNSNNMYENIEDRWARIKVGAILSRYEDDENHKMIRSNHRLETYTDIEGMYKHIAECDALGTLFSRYNVKYYYWSYGNMVRFFPKKERDYLLQHHNWLDNGISTWEYERIDIKRDPHPSLTGHKQLAEIIYNKIKEEK